MCFFLSWSNQANSDGCSSTRILLVGLCLGFFISSYFYADNYDPDQGIQNQFNYFEKFDHELSSNQNNGLNINPNIFMCPYNEILNKTLNLKTLISTLFSCSKQSQSQSQLQPQPHSSFDCQQNIAQYTSFHNNIRFRTKDFPGYWKIPSSSHVLCLQQNLALERTTPSNFDIQINFVQATVFLSQISCIYDIHVLEISTNPIHFDQLRQIPKENPTRKTKTISQFCKIKIQGSLDSQGDFENKNNWSYWLWLFNWIYLYDKSYLFENKQQKRYCFDSKLFPNNHFIPNIFGSEQDSDDKHTTTFPLPYCLELNYHIILYDLLAQQKANDIVFNNWQKTTTHCTSSLFQCVFQITTHFSSIEAQI